MHRYICDIRYIGVVVYDILYMNVVVCDIWYMMWLFMISDILM